MAALVAMIASCSRCAEIVFADDVEGDWIACPDCGLDLDARCLDWRRSDSILDVQP